MACLLQNDPASYVDWRVKPLRGTAEAKASPKRAKEEQSSKSVGVDPKPGDLAMARLKLR